MDKKIDITTPSTTIPDAAEEVDVQTGRLREWIDRNYVNVDAPAESRRDKHLLSWNNILEAKLFKHLLDRGFYRKQSAEVVAAFRKEPEKRIIRVQNDRGELSFESFRNINEVSLSDESTDVFIVNVDKL